MIFIARSRQANEHMAPGRRSNTLWTKGAARSLTLKVRAEKSSSPAFTSELPPAYDADTMSESMAWPAYMTRLHSTGMKPTSATTATLRNMYSPREAILGPPFCSTPSLTPTNTLMAIAATTAMPWPHRITEFTTGMLIQLSMYGATLLISGARTNCEIPPNTQMMTRPTAAAMR